MRSWRCRKKAELDQIICWLTGYTLAARAMNPNVSPIKGVVCGLRVEEVADPLMREIRYLDKLVDELAKGKTLDRILRA
jgi:hypothetical protein